MKVKFNSGIAVVTGAASGIGLAMGKRLASQGMFVALADNDADGLERAEALLPRNSSLIRCLDVASRSEMVSFADEVLQKFGPVTLLCNNAGVSGPLIEAAWEVTPEEWDRVIGINFYGVVNGIASFVPTMIASGEPGHVINTASELGVLPSSGTVCYSASKHAVVALSEALQLQFVEGEIPIGVTILCPGPVDTNILANEQKHIEGRGGRVPTHKEVASRASGSEFVRLKADEVVDATLAGAEAGELFVFTHEATKRRLEKYYAELLNTHE